MKFKKIENDTFGMVLQSDLEVKEGGKSVYGRMFVCINENKMIMAITISYSKEEAEACVQIFIETVKRKE